MEKFEYTQGKVYRRKTLTFIQKAILSSIWIFISIAMISGIMLQQQGSLPQSNIILVLVIFAPLILGAIVMGYIGFNPKGPEKDFILPTVEIDPDDTGIVKGTVILKDNQKIEVEVIVPNVYGANLNILESGTGLPQQGAISPDEMIDLALEEITKKYPDSQWNERPEVISN